MNKQKHSAAVLALLLAFVMLFSVLFLVLEAEHDCCGEGCLVCALLRACESFLRHLLPISALLPALGFLCAPVRSFPGSDRRFAEPHSLILWKVKLSD